MFTFLAVCIIIVCVLITLIVLVQNSKGGGLASSFASSNQIMGVKKTADFLERSTWGLAAVLFVLCLASSMALPSANESTENTTKISTEIKQDVETPTTPIESPVEEGTDSLK